MGRVFTPLQRLKDGCLDALSSHFTRWTKPLRASLPLATLTDLGRSKSELIAENALLRQQLIILRRQVKRPTFTRTDRMLLVLLARLVRSWQQALVIVQPDTLLRWHRELFRLFWKHKSKAPAHQPKVASATIALIRQMAKDNRLWGAERIRGVLLKLGIHVCKRTIQKYMRTVRTRQSRGQKWATDLEQPRRTGLVLRLPTGDRSLLSATLCVLQRRTEVATGDPCRGHSIAFRSLGDPTTARSHSVWASTEISHSR
jgi:putative transposase